MSDFRGRKREFALGPRSTLVKRSGSAGGDERSNNMAGAPGAREGDERSNSLVGTSGSGNVALGGRRGR